MMKSFIDALRIDLLWIFTFEIILFLLAPQIKLSYH